MAEFRSSLFRHLAAAAEIPFNPNLPANEVVYRATDEDGAVVQYINDDQRRMEAMKTAIIKLILLRACNDMNNRDEDDNKDISKRVAKSMISIQFADANIDHKDGSSQNSSFFDRAVINAVAAGTSSLGGPTATVAMNKELDQPKGKPDPEIVTIRMNFQGDVEALVRKPMLVFNCPKPT